MSLPFFLTKAFISKWISEKARNTLVMLNSTIIREDRKKTEEQKEAQHTAILETLHNGIKKFWLLYPDLHTEFFELHKDLRQYLQENGNDGQPERDLAIVCAKVIKLQNISFEATALAADTAAKGLTKYYEQLERAQKCLPRVGIKVYSNGNWNNDIVFDHPEQLIDHVDFSDQALEAIRKNEPYYLNPDIPAAVKRGEYSNPRLNSTKAAAYRIPTEAEIEEMGKDSYPYVDDNWASNWKDCNEQSSHYSWFYKSSLVFPVRLSADSTRYPAIKKLFVDSKSLTAACIYMDHLKPNFFSENNKTDLYVVGIYAHMLAYPLLYRLCLITNSNTYQDALDFVKDTHLWAYESLTSDFNPLP